MKRIVPALSTIMLLAGGFLVLAGLAWGIWIRRNAPPPPVISDKGAVVMAETASPVPTTQPTITTEATATPLPTPTEHPQSGPTTTEMLAGQTATATPSPWATNTATPAPTATPTATRPPQAEKPPTRIVAPSIGLDAPVESMGWEMLDRDGTMTSRWLVPEDAAGWHMNSALPGQKENIVLSGHHNIGGKVFRYVVDLHVGDEITLYANDVPYVYTVTEKYILKEAGMSLKVRKQNAQWIMPTGDERLTLVTCWPYEWPGNSHRVIVVARPPGYVNPQDTGVE